MDYYIPDEDSHGECYHTSNHTGDRLVKAEEEEVRRKAKAGMLRPCGLCVAFHGLEPLA